MLASDCDMGSWILTDSCSVVIPCEISNLGQRLAFHEAVLAWEVDMVIYAWGQTFDMTLLKAHSSSQLDT